MVPGYPPCREMTDSNPKIIHVVAGMSRDLGGPPQSISNLCAHLDREGFRTEIVSTPSDNVVDIAPNVSTHFFPTVGPSRLGYSPRMERYLKDACAGSVILHSHSLWAWTGLHARNAAAAKGAPLVISPRGTLEPWALSQKQLKKKLAYLLWEHGNLTAASMFHATSQMEANGIRALGFRQPIALVPNGVELSPLPNRSGETGCRTLLFLSRIHPKKGLELLLKAWSRLAPGFPDWRLVVAGSGDRAYVKDMMELAKSLGAGSERIQFPGPVHGLAKWELYSRSNLFALPTHSENFGNVIGEALGAGVPVITTHGAPWECLDKHGFGWWIPVGLDPLLEALREALASPDEVLREKGSRARAWAAENLSWPSVAHRMGRAYHWLEHGEERPEWVLE